MTDALRLQPAAIGTADSPSPAGKATAPTPDSPRFRELLERMQRLAADHRTAPPVDNADQLQAAMRSADDGFLAAMDLRRQLEDAFRRHAP